jgi:hypothetical protein
MILVAFYLMMEKLQHMGPNEACGEESLSCILYSADGEIHICMMHVWAYVFTGMRVSQRGYDESRPSPVFAGSSTHRCPVHLLDLRLEDARGPRAETRAISEEFMSVRC